MNGAGAMDFIARKALLQLQRRIDAARDRGRAIAEQRLAAEQRDGPKVRPSASGRPERYAVPVGHRRHEVVAHFDRLGYRVETLPGYVVMKSRDINRDAEALEATPGARPILTKQEVEGRVERAPIRHVGPIGEPVVEPVVEVEPAPVIIKSFAELATARPRHRAGRKLNTERNRKRAERRRLKAAA